MRKNIYALVAFAALCAGLGSCVNDNKELGELPAPAQEPLDQGFSITTRANDITGEPEDQDTYTIMSYTKAYTGSTTTYSNQIANSYNYMKQYGYYAYDGTGRIGAVGDLIPVQVSTTTYKAVNNPFLRNQAHGQRLVGIPVTGTNTNNVGYYFVSIIHPAIPVYNASELGLLAVFNRTDDVYASHPDDRNGDGVKNDPFEITVRENMDVHQIDGSKVKMYPVRAAIRAYLYSHFYVDDNPGANPTPQSVNFTVDEVSLVNAGYNGWYNPRMDMVYPNYNYTSKSVYNKDVNLPSGNPTANVTTLIAEANSEIIPTRFPTIYATAQYLVQEKVNSVLQDVRVFPTDYRGEEGGGSPFVIPMTLSLKLKDNNGLPITASAPIAMVIERNKLYKFYVNVKSNQIEIQYSRSTWNPVTGDYDDIGGTVSDLVTVNINKSNGGWNDQPGGNTDIGD